MPIVPHSYMLGTGSWTAYTITVLADQYSQSKVYLINRNKNYIMYLVTPTRRKSTQTRSF